MVLDAQESNCGVMMSYMGVVQWEPGPQSLLNASGQSSCAVWRPLGQWCSA